MKRALATLAILGLAFTGCSHTVYKNGDVFLDHWTLGRAAKGSATLGDNAQVNFDADVSRHSPEMVAALIEGARLAAERGLAP